MSAVIRDPVARDRAWARWLSRCGARPMIERVTYKRYSESILRPAERVTLWRRKYELCPVEQQCAPITRNPNAVLINRAAPEPLLIP